MSHSGETVGGTTLEATDAISRAEAVAAQAVGRVRQLEAARNGDRIWGRLKLGFWLLLLVFTDLGIPLIFGYRDATSQIVLDWLRPPLERRLEGSWSVARTGDGTQTGKGVVTLAKDGTFQVVLIQGSGVQQTSTVMTRGFWDVRGQSVQMVVAETSISDLAPGTSWREEVAEIAEDKIVTKRQPGDVLKTYVRVPK